jgi:hypothetical protein
MCAVGSPVKPGGRPAGTGNCDAARSYRARNPLADQYDNIDPPSPED